MDYAYHILSLAVIAVLLIRFVIVARAWLRLDGRAENAKKPRTHPPSAQLRTWWPEQVLRSRIHY